MFSISMPYADLDMKGFQRQISASRVVVLAGNTLFFASA